MTSELLDENAKLTIKELCTVCKVEAGDIVTYVEEGLLIAEGKDRQNWRFSETSIINIQKATRLRQDLGLNPAGVALVFDLLSQIDELKTRLNQLDPEE